MPFLSKETTQAIARIAGIGHQRAQAALERTQAALVRAEAEVTRFREALLPLFEPQLP
ncbi:hypothetical protein OC842_007594 [Tilletia horrida]|uniref:Uncharacterized protein n=1 Tax=Tilletia horrida TaxID=155126 RepID=A0AAN6G3L3_9BASI|nr:hypothetical protein OC842_007594 [Tilletia horrida]